MKTLLLETNAINQAYSKHISGIKLKHIITSLHFIAIVNQHTPYELYRIYLNTKKAHIGKQLFTILKDLEPIYTCQTETLLTREVEKLRSGKSVDCIIEPNFKPHLEKSIIKAANGDTDKSSLIFIKKKEKEIENFNESFIKKIPYSYYKNIKNFQLYRKMFFEEEESKIRDFLKRCIWKSNLTETEICHLLNNINSYPAIRTTMNAQLYFNYLTIKNPQQKFKHHDDFRHLIDSSYCTALVSNDKKLKKYAAEINSNIEIIELESILACHALRVRNDNLTN